MSIRCLIVDDEPLAQRGGGEVYRADTSAELGNQMLQGAGSHRSVGEGIHRYYLPRHKYALAIGRRVATFAKKSAVGDHNHRLPRVCARRI